MPFAEKADYKYEEKNYGSDIVFGNGFNVCSWMRTEKETDSGKSEEKSSGKVEIEFVQVNVKQQKAIPK